jgi:hypothetical protein
MTENSHGRPVIDICAALGLLAAAVERRGADFVYRSIRMDKPRYFACRHANRGGPDCIVGQALALANVGARELEAIDDHGIRELYLRGKLPVPLTLGAVMVFEAAKRSQDRGHRWGDVLAHAAAAAAKFLDLLPDTVFVVAHRSSDDASPLSS